MGILYWYLLFSQFIHKIIIHDIIYQIMYGYFDVYFVLFKDITSEMKTYQKIIINLINENILKRHHIKTRWMIFEDKQFVWKHIFYIRNPSISLFLFDYTCSYMYVIYISMQHSIWFSIGKIAEICHVPPVWNVLSNGIPSLSEGNIRE